MFSIGIDASWLVNYHTGIGKCTRQWINHLAAIDKGNKYFLFGINKDRLPGDICQVLVNNSNFIYVEIDFPNLYKSGISMLIWDQLLLQRAVYTNKCDIVFFPYFNASLSLLKRSVVTITDLAIFRDYGDYSFSQRIYYNFLLKTAVHRARGLVAISEATRQDALKYLGVAPERIEVVHPGVDAHYFPVLPDEAKAWCRQRYGLVSHFVLYTGGLTLRKNISRMLRAFVRARQALMGDITLVLTGHLSPDAPVAKILREYDDSMVIYLGVVPEKELKYLYSAAEVVLYPSLYEGFGLPIVEAQACGAAVITSNVTSMPEISGEAALLVNPFDESDIENAIIKVVSDSGLREDLYIKGIANAARFSWSKGAERLMNIFLQKINELQGL